MQTLKSFGHAPVNGIEMYYEIHGEGNVPLVLIHGGGSTIESNYGVMLPLLAGFTKVIAVELQAHGRTTDRPEPETFEQDADDVAALLNYLKIPKANILGFSNGGTTTLQIAIRHAHLINKIIVVSANYKLAGMVPGFFDGLANATLNDMPGTLKNAFLKVTPDQARLQNMFEKDKARMLNFKDIPAETIHAITAPTLLMVGDKDVMTVEHILDLHKLIDGSQLVVLPGGHGEMLGEVCTNANNKLPLATAVVVEKFLILD